MTNQTILVVTKAFAVTDIEKRTFEGIATAQIVDKQAEVAIVDSFIKNMPIFIKSGGFMIDWHTNRVVGKATEFARIDLMEEGTDRIIPAVKIKGEVFNRGYASDDAVWAAIQSGDYKGLSFGGAVKKGAKQPIEMDGRMAYALNDIEIHEISFCPSPVNPVAVITHFNQLAKAEGGRICTGMTCYFEVQEEPIIKADTTTATATIASTETSTVSDTNTMFINANETLKYKSDMTEDNKVTAPAPEVVAKADESTKSQPKTLNTEELLTSLTKSFSESINSGIGAKLDAIVTKLDKALDTPTDLPVADKATVALPSDPYNGKSEQGGVRGATASKEAPETDKVTMEKKAEEPKNVVKAEAVRPTVTTASPAQEGKRVSIPVLDELRKSTNPNRMGIMSNKILYDRDFVTKAIGA